MRRGIRLRLLGAFSILCMVTLLLGLWALLQVRALAAMEAQTYDQPLMAATYINAAATIFEQLANPQLASSLAQQKREGDDPVGDLFADIDVARQRATSAPTAAAIDRAARLARGFLSRPGAAAAARQAFELAGESVLDDGFLSRTEAATAEKRAQRFVLIAVAVATILSMALAFMLATRFVKPIRAATAIADRIAAGNLSVAVQPGKNDEIGTLLAALGQMQARIRAMIEEERGRAEIIQRRLEGMLAGATEAMVLLDDDDRFVDANPRGRMILQMLGVQPVAGARLGGTPGAGLLGAGEVMLRDGAWLAPSRHGLATGGSFLVLTDITLRKAYEARLETAAFRDPLTGLNNHSFFIAALEVENAITPGDVLLLANLDRLRQINRIYGALAGDAVIVETGRRLQRLVTAADLCARIDGDEFAILLRAPGEARMAALTATLAGALAVPIASAPPNVRATARIGLTRGDATSTAESLLREARAALDQARRKGPGEIVSYDGALRAAAHSRHVIDRDLPAAIADGAITLDYQPLVNLASGAVVGVEALARWQHPELGKVPPPWFIGAAEESGAIVALGHMVLTKAAASANNWSKLAQGGLTVAVNLSPRQLVDPRSVAAILAFLEAHVALAPFLKFEITESVLIDDPEAMLRVLRELKARGIQLSLDDFGTGYSSLSYLHQFPFDVLKIDQSFVRDIDRRVEARRLVRTIVELGRDLGMTVVAEGIETGAQAALLRDLGAHVGQGYLFSRPMRPEAIPAFIAEHASRYFSAVLTV